MKTLERNVEELYEMFFNSLDIDSNTGILGKVKPEYKDKIRFSGYPYIGNKYLDAKKKILFYGLDIGNDELYSNNTFHNFETRRLRVLGEKRSIQNHHQVIGAIYTITLGVLKDHHTWSGYEELLKYKDKTIKSVLADGEICKKLPNEVLDYIAFSNIHKFVTVGREGRAGQENRRWYNKKEEIKLLFDEISILKPDIVVLMGSGNNKILIEPLKSLGIVVKWMPHPSTSPRCGNKNAIINKFDEIANDIMSKM